MIKILIVDDSIFSQKIISSLIKNNLDHVEIFYADDGQEGLIKYLELKPDYILIDLLMPKLSGGDLVKLIKEYNSDAKIIVLSADVQKNVKEEMEAFNIMLFLNKPFNQEKAQLVCDMIRNSKNG